MLPIQFLHSVLLEECSVGDIQYPISYAQLTGRKKETRARLLRCHKRLLHFTTFPFLFSNIKRPVSDSTRRRHISFSSTPRVSVQQMTTRGVSLAKRRGGWHNGQVLSADMQSAPASNIQCAPELKRRDESFPPSRQQQRRRGAHTHTQNHGPKRFI